MVTRRKEKMIQIVATILFLIVFFLLVLYTLYPKQSTEILENIGL
jgi:TRAP-type mannitol/chloroaromatic compound transport system permease small subunit